jgi:hypothetical protein
VSPGRRLLPWIAASAVALGGLACARPAPATSAASPSRAPDAAARADRAAMYALPLVIMDLTREQFFAGATAADATPDRFLHIPVLANPSFRSVVRPNVDTLYSTAWLDLRADPVLLTVPPSSGRYFLVQCMDAWTNVFAAPGIRTLGDRGATYAIVGPDWRGPPPAGAEIVHAPTRMVWVLARVYVREPADLAAARAFQRQLDLRPSSRANDPIERHAIKSGDALPREPDGSLVIYLSPDDPGPAHRASWLPTPPHQRFELSLRAYWPEDALREGRWTPPAVVPADGW